MTMKRGRKAFASSVGRPSFGKPRSSTSKSANSKHPYGDDWPAQSALCKKRDDYRCMAHKVGMPKCANRFPPPLTNLLHAHHIHPWIKSKNNSLKNLVTLCISCHSREHGGKFVGYSASKKQIDFSKKLR